jgi:hypothetical protein
MMFDETAASAMRVSRIAVSNHGCDHVDSCAASAHMLSLAAFATFGAL